MFSILIYFNKMLKFEMLKFLAKLNLCLVFENTVIVFEDSLM